MEQSPKAGSSYSEIDDDQKVSQNECEICEQPGHGTHFGAFTCRACAAFFRRTSIYKKKHTCRTKKFTCRIGLGERYLCRYCRYQKCIQLGMTEERIQLNRDPFTAIESSLASSPDSESKKQNKDSSEEDTNSAEDSQSNIPKSLEGKSGLFLVPTIQHIFRIFKPEEVLEEPIKNDIHGMMLALRRYRSGQQLKTMLFEYFLLPAFSPYWEVHQMRFAEWLMFSKEFREMEETDKICLLFNRRYAFRRIERLQMSLIVYGQSFLKDRIYVVTDEFSARYDHLKYDETKPKLMKVFKELFRLTAPNEDKVITEIAAPLLELQLTEIEFTYLLCQLVFHVEGNEISSKAQEAAIKFKNRISDDMHNYYTNELKMENYCSRLIDIMNIVSNWEHLMLERVRILEMAHLFDVIGYDLSGVF